MKPTSLLQYKKDIFKNKVKSIDHMRKKIRKQNVKYHQIITEIEILI
jgi:hypothetical protein